MKKVFALGTTVIALPLALSLSAGTAHAGFYDGKDVTVLIGSGAGGGLTRAGRAVMTAVGRFLGKDTNMVIKNMPGAGGAKALNFFAAKARPDGLTLSFGPPRQIGKLLNMPGVRFEPAEFVMIGANDASFVSIVSTTTGVKKPTDILNAKGLIVGGRSPASSLDIFARVPLQILGIDHGYVPGYRGQPKLKAAIMGGEINALTTGFAGHVAFYENDLLKKGTAIALYYHSALDKNGEPIRLPEYPPNIKHFVDFYKDTHGGKAPSGPKWEAYKWYATYNTRAQVVMAPKGTPAERVAELRAAYKAAIADPTFRAAYKKQFKIIPNFWVGKDAEWLLTDYKKISPEALAGMKAMAGPAKKKK